MDVRPHASTHHCAEKTLNCLSAHIRPGEKAARCGRKWSTWGYVWLPDWIFTNCQQPSLKLTRLLLGPITSNLGVLLTRYIFSFPTKLSWSLLPANFWVEKGNSAVHLVDWRWGRSVFINRLWAKMDSSAAVVMHHIQSERVYPVHYIMMALCD